MESESFSDALSTSMSTILEVVEFKNVADFFNGIAGVVKPIAATGLEWAGIKEIPNIFQ